MKIVCKTCGGKGHIINRECMVFLPVISWIFAALEHDDRNSLTRKDCGNCKGKGFIILIAKN